MLLAAPQGVKAQSKRGDTDGAVRQAAIREPGRGARPAADREDHCARREIRVISAECKGRVAGRDQAVRLIHDDVADVRGVDAQSWDGIEHAHHHLIRILPVVGIAVDVEQVAMMPGG